MGCVDSAATFDAAMPGAGLLAPPATAAACTAGSTPAVPLAGWPATSPISSAERLGDKKPMMDR